MESLPFKASRSSSYAIGRAKHEFSRVQISNPSLLSSGDNDQLYDLMYLDGIINGSSHDNCPSSLGAHTMHIGEFISKIDLLFFVQVSIYEFTNEIFL